MTPAQDRGQAFHRRHDSGCFVIPNPWDVGSARALEQLGLVTLATVEQLAQAGVRRISVGGALARAAWTGVPPSAHEIAKRGTFAGLSSAVPFGDINRMFGPE